MFELTDSVIDIPALTAKMNTEEAGAFTSFEGRVRRQNLDREVVLLEYEAAPEIAGTEFAKIESEALRKFEIIGLTCVHRSGTLEIGDAAVWVGVTAAHRDAAFKACRYVIDEIKTRLPIWKKEHYTDGDSGWLNHP